MTTEKIASAHTFLQFFPVITSHPPNVEYILKTKMNNFIKGSKMKLSLQELLGEGIFIANHAHTADDGASWKLQRKIASRIFTGNRFRVCYVCSLACSYTL
jgi:hypothetical protein